MIELIQDNLIILIAIGVVLGAIAIGGALAGGPISRVKDKFSELGLDFVGYRRLAATVSAILVLLSWVVFFVVGPNWGIDFTGGTEIQLRFKCETAETCADISDLRDALGTLGLSDDAVQAIGEADKHEYIVRIQDATFGADEFRQDVEARLVQSMGDNWIAHTRFDAEVGARLTVEYTGDELTGTEIKERIVPAFEDMNNVQVQPGKDDNQIIVKGAGLSQQIERKIHAAMGEHDFEVVATDAVGPKVGGELRRQGFISIAATLGLVLLYVAFRFDVAFAPGAILALFHDVSLTLGLFVLFQRELNLPIIGALLTIVGYSLNDTIVIYDRIRENMDRYRRSDLPDLINVSINETLARTLATSITTMMAMVAFLAWGGPVIENFALAMMLGIVFGTYSTVYVASPTILVMQDIKPWLQRMLSTGAVEEDQQMVASGSEGAGEDGGDKPDALMTASERRRRERARLAKSEDDV